MQPFGKLTCDIFLSTLNFHRLWVMGNFLSSSLLKNVNIERVFKAKGCSQVTWGQWCTFLAFQAALWKHWLINGLGSHDEHFPSIFWLLCAQIWHHLRFFHMHRCFKCWYPCQWGHLYRKEQRPPVTVRAVTSLSTLEIENLTNNYRESSAACQQGLLDVGNKTKPSACVFSLSSL